MKCAAGAYIMWIMWMCCWKQLSLSHVCVRHNASRYNTGREFRVCVCSVCAQYTQTLTCRRRKVYYWCPCSVLARECCAPPRDAYYSTCVSGGARVQLIIERLHAAGELQDLRLPLGDSTHTMHFSLQSTWINWLGNHVTLLTNELNTRTQSSMYTWTVSH